MSLKKNISSLNSSSRKAVLAQIAWFVCICTSVTLNFSLMSNVNMVVIYYLVIKSLSVSLTSKLCLFYMAVFSVTFTKVSTIFLSCSLVPFLDVEIQHAVTFLTGESLFNISSANNLKLFCVSAALS